MGCIGSCLKTDNGSLCISDRFILEPIMGYTRGGGGVFKATPSLDWITNILFLGIEGLMLNLVS